MGKRFIIALVLMACGLTGWAQGDISEKLSATTQMFLDDLKSGSKRGDSKGGETTEQKLYASPETIDGRDYISCFLRLKDNTDTKALEKLGVIVQCRFDKGIVTAYVPVDNLLKVADLASVNQVSVASLMTPTTHVARVKTNTDDVLTYSDDARYLGLSKGYDGTGVLLGVIDTGIDFQHIAFKDKNGNSRIVGAYVYNGSNGQEFTSATDIDHLETDNDSQDHGTHTSSTAGGSSVIVDGSTVTVTDDHASATYGGMAPGASLYLAGLKSLKNTHLANATQKIVEFADAHGMPVVVNNSWGSQDGPHDGTGYMAEIYNQYFGDDHPNHIALFASSNDAGFLPDGATGGYHVSGTASFGSPLSTVVRYKDNAIKYPTYLAYAWTRSTSVSGLAVKVYVLSTNDGSVKTSATVNSTGVNSTETVSVPEEYCETGGTLKIIFNNVNGKKKQAIISSSKLIMKEGYTLAMDIYPATAEDGETIIDVWGGNDCYFTDVPFTSGHNWTAGDDDMTASDESTIASVISIGAYVSNRRFKSSDGHTYSYTSFTDDDIAPFSSYATTSESPDGKQYPWITAPGATLVAGVNQWHTAGIAGSYYGSKELIVNNENCPYGVMNGTSMATPTAAGIVALWLQAAKERGIALTTSGVKEIMRNTAIHDDYTAGTNASHFGNGKIDALAGLKATTTWSDAALCYVLNDKENNSAAIGSIPSNNTVSIMLSGRTLYRDNAWNTICLPFDISDTDLTDGKTFTGTPLEGAIVKELDTNGTGLDGTTLNLNFKDADEIKAGTPYIIRWANDTYHPTILSPVFNGVTIDNSAAAIARKTVSFNGGQFIGTYDSQTFSAADQSILFLGVNNENKSTLYWARSGATIGAQRAYFQLSSGTQARSFSLNFGEGDDATGIISMEDVRGKMEDVNGFWYSLDGRRLASKPIAKGVYIHNGKKVVIR